MESHAKQVFKQEMNVAKARYAARQWAETVHHLERAHIVGQRYFWGHLVTHLWMLRVAWARRDGREAMGQITRILAVPLGYVFGWVPVGNTGGANVSPVRPMPIPQDLQSSFVGYSLWRQILWRVVVFAAVALVAWVMPNQESGGSAAAQSQSLAAGAKLADFGSTTTLEITPLVNWHTQDPSLRTEAGVSYLVKTDSHTVLFDTGWNAKDEDPSPLQHNMARLGVSVATIDAIFISHAHHDHVGGMQWERGGSFALGKQQGDLSGKQVYAPVTMTYPGTTVQTVTQATALLPAIASTGGIARKLTLGRIDEQAMVIHVAGKGLVAIVGCGHQTVPKLLAQIQRDFNVPLYGIVGDLHYPVPDGRRSFMGLNLQRLLASGDGITRPITMEQIQSEMELLERSNIQLLGIGGHDSSDEVIDLFAKRFGSRYRHVLVGKPITL